MHGPFHKLGLLKVRHGLVSALELVQRQVIARLQARD